jgi:geranylgeranyl diphosphate synthase type II
MSLIPNRNSAGILESALLRLLPQCGPPGVLTPGLLSGPLHCAVFPGGKRLRPWLTIFGARIVSQPQPDEGPPEERVLRAACAVEFVHASSLILDDLPCMDNAHLRRGNPALHRVFGEDRALLTGLALLNQAYALFGETPELIREAAECIGVDGMIGGQAIDLCPDIEKFSLEERDRKTSALMRLALTAGALTLGASREQVAPLASAGLLLGRAYQICDDILDAGAPIGSTGKTTGQDARHGRPSHASSHTRFAEVESLVEEMRRSLVDAFGVREGVAGLMGFIEGIFASQFQGAGENARSTTV